MRRKIKRGIALVVKTSKGHGEAALPPIQDAGLAEYCKVELIISVRSEVALDRKHAFWSIKCLEGEAHPACVCASSCSRVPLFSSLASYSLIALEHNRMPHPGTME